MDQNFTSREAHVSPDPNLIMHQQDATRKLVSLGTMGDQSRAPMKPLEHHKVRCGGLKDGPPSKPPLSRDV